GSYKERVNEIGTFSVDVPMSMLRGHSVVMEEIIIQRDSGAVLIAGIVTDDSKIKLSNGLMLSEIVGLNRLGDLMLNYYRKTISHYRDIPVMVIVQDLLSASGGAWKIGDFSSLRNRNER